MGEIQEFTIGSLIEDKKAHLQTGPFGTMLNASEYSKSGTPVIAVQDIGENQLRHDKFVFVPDEVAERLSRYRVKKNDIIFGRKGAVERRALIKNNEDGWLQGSDCIRLRLDDSIDPRFVAYQLGDNYHRNWLQQFATGATMPSLNQEVLKMLPLFLPDLPEQKAIAEVLSSLDDKIDLLHRQNKTLESLAQTLFRQWFIEEAEESWPLRVLADTCAITRGSSPRPIIEFVTNGTVPWIKIADATGSDTFFIDRTREFIIEAGVKNSVTVAPGDLIMSNSATCGFPFFVELQGCIHDGWLLFRDFKEISSLYMFFFLKQIYRELNNFADGSVQDNLNTTILKEYPIKIPPKLVVEKFDYEGGLILDKIKRNVYQARTLSKLRDSLLPKLMSNELRVDI